MSRNLVKLRCRLSSDLINQAKLNFSILSNHQNPVSFQSARRLISTTTAKFENNSPRIGILKTSTKDKFAAMRFIQFKLRNDPTMRLGVVSEDGTRYADLTTQSSYPKNMIDFIRSDPSVEDLAKKMGCLKWDCVDDNLCLLPPVPNPEKIICIGLNYADHCKEQNKEPPKEPMFFSKYASALTGPTGQIIHPSITTKLDWEVELAVVIGKEVKYVDRKNAFDCIFGYTVAQDISARDWQKERNGGQFLMGKSMDTFCPLGPSIVHKCLIPDPHNLTISCNVNGKSKQRGSTSQLIYRIDDIISRLTKCMTLKPGDIILTGTPSGVGMHRNPPEYLKPGDLVESEIESIGKLHNTVVNESK